MTLHAYTDGASRGNPGESGIGVLVRDESGAVLATIEGYIGTATNNEAEYTAMEHLLGLAERLSCSRLVVHSDSELMVRQLNGRYRVRDAGLKQYFLRVNRLREALPCGVEFRHIPREQNEEADALANRAIDTRRPVQVTWTEGRSLPGPPGRQT
jgi:ribonuclease HI